MLLNVYSIHDRKAGIFNRPFMENLEVIAVRNVERAFQDPESTFSAYPNDFELVQLGQYDDLTGKFELFDIPKLIDFNKTI